MFGGKMGGRLSFLATTISMFIHLNGNNTHISYTIHIAVMPTLIDITGNSTHTHVGTAHILMQLEKPIWFLDEGNASIYITLFPISCYRYDVYLSSCFSFYRFSAFRWRRRHTHNAVSTIRERTPENGVEWKNHYSRPCALYRESSGPSSIKLCGLIALTMYKNGCGGELSLETWPIQSYDRHGQFVKMLIGLGKDQTPSSSLSRQRSRLFTLLSLECKFKRVPFKIFSFSSIRKSDAW